VAFEFFEQPAEVILRAAINAKRRRANDRYIRWEAAVDLVSNLLAAPPTDGHRHPPWLAHGPLEVDEPF